MVTIGSPAPDSTWKIAWENLAAVPEGTKTISLSSCLGKVVLLLLANVQG